jgi:Flp pilus assembly protein TadG
MRSHRSAGQSLAEFALVLPIFLLIVMALFDLGRGVFIYNGLTNAAREAARLAIVNQDKDLVAERAQAMAFGTEITTPPATLVNFYRAGPNSDDVEANPPCDNSDATHAIAVGCIAVVEAQATWQAVTPIIGNLIGPIVLNARSELPIELVCPNAVYPAYATSDLCPRQP